MRKPNSQIIIYQTEEGKIRLEVRLDDETVWLTQSLMAELFQTSSDNISLHLKNIYAEAELDAKATTEDFSAVQKEGKRNVRRTLKHYNLDAIISVGYRVNSKRGVRFRQWATNTLKQHLIKGYTVNERRLAEKGLSEMEQTIL
ncbi:MAG: virulence RhuM family protein [Cyclobacteriaceae bacterium]|nr:virulence RhuM family protein [Cyclobacteriaceae bacterium]